MNFDFDDTQYALRDLARDLFAKESPSSRIRELWEGKPFDRNVWKTMADAGLCGITVPEGFGGAGGNDIDMTLVYEEAGRAALPEPVLATAGVAAPLLTESENATLRDRWLPAIASGDAIASVHGLSSDRAAFAAEADLIVSISEDEVHVVPSDRVRTTQVDSIDLARPLFEVEVDAGPDTLVGRGEAVLRTLARGFFGTAALLNGVAMHLLEATVAYVKDREQFGRPVGSFQAVKHKLASMHVAIESSRPATWYAGYAIATGAEDLTIAAAVAKIAANDAEALCNDEALQCHGGIGFTWEHDLHLWLKRGMSLRSEFGSSSALRRQFARVHSLEELL